MIQGISRKKIGYLQSIKCIQLNTFRYLFVKYLNAYRFVKCVWRVSMKN